VPLEVVVPFIEDDGCTFAIVGPNWSAGAFLMHIRQSFGDTTTPVITLSNAAAGTQGISATYDAAYVIGTGAIVPATKILVQIDEATLEALPLGTPATTPVNYVYDLHVTPTGKAKRVVMFGKIAIYPGSTI